jgi:hypothetical protein
VLHSILCLQALPMRFGGPVRLPFRNILTEFTVVYLFDCTPLTASKVILLRLVMPSSLLY